MGFDVRNYLTQPIRPELQQSSGQPAGTGSGGYKSKSGFDVRDYLNQPKATTPGVGNTGAGAGNNDLSLPSVGKADKGSVYNAYLAEQAKKIPIYTEKTAAELEAPRQKYENAKADSEAARRYYRGLTQRAAALDESIRRYEAERSVRQTMGTPEAIAEAQKLQTMLDAAYDAQKSIQTQLKGFEGDGTGSRYKAGQILDDKALEKLRREAEAGVAENYMKQVYYYANMMKREGVTPERTRKLAQLLEQAKQQETAAKETIRNSLMQYDPMGWLTDQGYSIAGLPGQSGDRSITAEQARQLAAAAAQRAANAGNEADRAREEAFAQGILDNLYVFMTPEELRAQRDALQAELDQGERTANNMATERRMAQAARATAKAKKAELDKLNNALASQEAAQTIQATAGTETGELIKEAVAFAYAETPEDRAAAAKRLPYITPDKTMNLENAQETGYEEYLRAIKRALKADGYDQQAIDNTVETLRREFNAERQRQQSVSIDQTMSRSGFGGWLARWGMTLASVPVNLLSGVGMLAPVATALNGSDYSTVDPNSAWFGPANAVNSIRESHQKYNAGGDWNDMLYGIITSSMDSVVGGLVGGGITKGMGLAGNAAAWVGGSVIGAEAAAQSMQDIAERGGSVSQVLTGGLMAGAFETFFEQFSLSQLKSLSQIDLRSAAADGKLWKTIAQNMVKGMLTNGSEELATEFFNVLYDTKTMGKLSNYGSRVAQYMAWGLSEEEARKRTAKDLANQVLEAGYTGALQGLLMDAGGLAVHGLDTWSDGISAQEGAGTTAEDTNMAEWREGMKNWWGQDPAAGQKNNASTGETTGPINVGQATTIKAPYQGAKPVQTQATGATVNVPGESLMNAEAMIQAATSAAAKGNASFKTMLTRLYQQVFQRHTGVPVNSMTYDGKPYLVEIGNKVPGKVISDPNLSSEKLALLDILPQVIQNAQYVGSGKYIPGNKGKNSAIRYDYFETPVQIGWKSYIAKFDVEVIPGANNYRTHQIVNVDLTTPEARLVGPVPTPSSDGPGPRSVVNDTNNIPQSPAESNTQNQAARDLSLPAVETQAGDGDMADWWERVKNWWGEDAAAAAEQRGTPGLLRDNYTENALDRNTVERLDRVAKALGLDVRFVDSVAGGLANSSIRGNQVLIEKGNPNPVNFLLGHEITHRMQELAPEQYQRFKELVANESDARLDARETLDNYRQKGLDLTGEGAMDEAVADYAGRMLEDGRLLDDFIRRHSGERTLLEKLRDAIRALWEKLHGGERRQAQQAVDRLNRALDAAAANVQNNTAAQESGGERYSIKQFEDGTKYVNIDVDQDRFAGLSVDEMQTEAKRIILDRFRNKTIGGQYTAYVNKKSAEHYAYPANRRMDVTQKRDKMQAAPELDNLLEAARFRENVPDDGRHPSATGGLDKLDVKFRVNGRTYDAEITVLVTDKGRIFYDMTKFRDITGREIGLAQSAAETSDNVSTNSIRHDNEKSNIKKYVAVPYEQSGNNGSENILPLSVRVSGDDLLNAEDLIDTIRDVGGTVDKNGYITVYHRTGEQAAKNIQETGWMSAKEDGLFFSTKEAGQNIGYGDAVIELHIPAEKLVLDDIFDDEAHLRMPLDGKNRRADVSEYIVDNEAGAKRDYSLKGTDHTRAGIERRRNGETRDLSLPAVETQAGDDAMAEWRKAVKAWWGEDALGENKTADLGEGTTEVNDNPAQHTAAEQRVIEEYKAAVDQGLVDFVENAKNHKGENAGRYELKPVSDRAAADIKNLTGVDTSGFKTVIEQRTAEHILKRHGENGKANQSMQDVNDIARMQYVLDHYDSVEHGGRSLAYTTMKPNGRSGQAQTVIFSKAVNGTYYVVEAVPDTKARTVYIDTAYMSNGKEKTGALHPTDAKSPSETSYYETAKAENAAAPVNLSIPQSTPESNGQNQGAELRDMTTDSFLDELTDGEMRRLEELGNAQNSGLGTEEGQRARQRDLDEFWESVRQTADMLEPRTVPEDQVSTRVQPKTQGRGEKAREAWSYFKRKMVDSGEAVTRIGKAVGDQNLYHFYNMARSSSNAATSMIVDGRTDIYGRETGKGLNAVMDAVRSKGEAYYKKFQLYMFHVHNIDRMNRFSQTSVDSAQAAMEDFRMSNPELMRYPDFQIERMAADESSAYYFEACEYMELRNALQKAENTTNKPVFGYDVTAEDSKAEADKLLRENPEFKAEAQEVYDYIDNLLRYRVDSGLITKEDYQQLKSVYPHYVPTYRVFERERPNTDTRRKNKVQIGSTVKRATGGSERLMPLHKALAQQTMSVVREGSKNRFGMRLLDSEARQKAAEHVRSIQEYQGNFSENGFDQQEDNSFQKKNTFVVRKDGRLWEMEVSPALYEAVQALSPDTPENNILTRVVRKANNLFKSLVTGKNPTFLVRNFMRDLQDAGLYSKDLSEFAKQYPQALAEIAKNGAYWKQYKALGGTFSSVFDYDTGEVKRGDRWHQKLLEKTFGRVETLNMAIEQAPRLAEFMATVKNAEQHGEVTMETLMEAMYNAAEITVNFGRSGTLGKVLNANYVPFLNPGIQGFSKMIRTVTETKGAKDWARLAVKAAVLGIAPALLNELLYGDDEDWDALKERDKDVYYLFKIGDHLWLKLPKGRTLSLLGMTADRAYDLARGEKVDWAGYIDTALSQSAPANPLENNILQAWFDADLLDKDSPGKTWYGSDIESQRLRNYAPGDRYDAKTDAISRWLGKTFDLSPAKINYLLDQYTGVAGDFLLPLLSPAAERGMFSAAFTIDSNYSNRYSGDFYGRMDELTYRKNAEDATGADDAIYRHWNKQQAAVSEVNKAIRKIEADETLSNKEKRELSAAQYAIRNGIMNQALETYETYAEAAQQYYAASEQKDEDDRADEAYREANREVFGAEYALSCYNKDVYDSAKKMREKTGLGYDKFYDFYFSAKNAADSGEKQDILQGLGVSDRQARALEEKYISVSHEERLSGLGLDIDQIAGIDEAKAKYGDSPAFYDYLQKNVSNKVLGDVEGIYGVKGKADVYLQTKGTPIAGYWEDLYDIKTKSESVKDEDGETIPGSKKLNVMLAIDHMDISVVNKFSALKALGYSEDNPPWVSDYSGKDYETYYYMTDSGRKGYEDYCSWMQISVYAKAYDTCRGQKQEENIEYIDSLDLLPDQKSALFAALGYAEKSLKKCPWYDPLALKSVYYPYF